MNEWVSELVIWSDFILQILPFSYVENELQGSKRVDVDKPKEHAGICN